MEKALSPKDDFGPSRRRRNSRPVERSTASRMLRCLRRFHRRLIPDPAWQPIEALGKRSGGTAGTSVRIQAASIFTRARLPKAQRLLGTSFRVGNAISCILLAGCGRNFNQYNILDLATEMQSLVSRPALGYFIFNAGVRRRLGFCECFPQWTGSRQARLLGWKENALARLSGVPASTEGAIETESVS